MSSREQSPGSRFRKWLGINYDSFFALREQTHASLLQMVIRISNLAWPRSTRKPKSTFYPRIEGLEVRQMLSNTVFFHTSAQTVNFDASSVTVEVDLSASSTKTITVQYQAFDATAVGGLDYKATSGTLSIPAGSTSGTFTVPMLSHSEPSNVYFNLLLSNPTNATLGSQISDTVTIIEPPTVAFFTATQSINYNATSATVEVDLSASSTKTITVNYQTNDGTAHTATDYSATSGTLTIKPGLTSGTFTVPLLGHLETSNVTFSVVLSSPSNATLGGKITDTITIVEQPTIGFRIATQSVNYNATSATVNVDLAAASTQTITVHYQTSDGTAHQSADYTNTSGTLSFSPGTTTLPIYVPMRSHAESSNATFSVLLSNSNNAILGSLLTDTVTILEPPIANNAGVSVLHGQTVSINVQGYASDPSGNPLTPTIVQYPDPAKGAIVFNHVTGKYDYTARSNYFGTDSFAYQVSDGLFNSSIATITVNVTDIAPLASNVGSVAVVHGHTVAVDLAAHVSDVDLADQPTISFVQASHGTVSLDPNTGKYNYVARSDYVGTDTFTFTANDGALNSNTATVSIVVSNSPPVAHDDPVQASAGHVLFVPAATGILSNDTDAEGDHLTVSLPLSPGSSTQHGSLSLNLDGSLTYTPSSGFVGTDTFTYQVFDGFVASNFATVTISVSDEPFSAPSSVAALNVNEGTALNHVQLTTFSDANLAAIASEFTAEVAWGDNATNWSTDTNSPITIAPVTGSPGTFAVFGSHLYSNVGVHTYQILITHDVTSTIALGTVTVNQLPLVVGTVADLSATVATPFTATLANFTEANLLVNSYWADVDWGDQTSGLANITPVQGQLGQFAVSGGHTYSLPGQYLVHLNIHDGVDYSKPAVVTVIVNDVAPTAISEAYTDLMPGTTYYGTGLLNGDSDILNIPLSAELIQGPANGTLLMLGDSSFSYTPVPGFSGSDTFAISAFDGYLNSDPVLISLTVNPPVPTPGAMNFSVHAGTPYSTTSQTGVLGGSTTATVSLVSGVAHGSFTIQGDGSFVYTPDAGYLGTDQFTYIISGGPAITSTLTVTDDAPVGVQDTYNVNAGDTYFAGQTFESAFQAFHR